MPSIVSYFQDVAAARSAEIALRSDLLPHPMSWGEYRDRVESVACSLIEWGVQPGDRVALISENRWEWHVADLAVMMVRGITVPIYPTSSAGQTDFILDHSGAGICVVSSADQLGKIASLNREPQALRRVIVMDKEVGEWPALRGVDVTAWPEADDTAAANRRGDLEERTKSIVGGDVATIVYTSGTTGRPKGVMLTHSNIVATVEMVTAVVPLGVTDRFLSFLPLSHIAERTVSHFGHIVSGGETWFAESFSTVAHDMTRCRPTVFFAVPRVWEKLRDSFEAELHRLPVLQRVLINKYLELGKRKYADLDAGHPTSAVRRAGHTMLDRTVGRRIRQGVGLDEAHALFSGAAPIDPDLLRWLRTLGLFVGEVYGQTEVCGPTTVASPHAIRIGTVGQALPGVALRLAEDGEIIVKGNNVCSGYYCDEVATTSLFDPDGWMKSGDLGVLDADGYLTITGRKKDLMKTALGKYIAPQELETRLRSTRFVANAVAVAEGRPYVTALLTLDSEAVTPWAQHRGKLLDLELLASDPDVLAEVGRQVDTVNEDVSPPERVKRWRILPREFTVESGELTPTLKVVRTAVMANFHDEIESLYPSKTSTQAPSGASS